MTMLLSWLMTFATFQAMLPETGNGNETRNKKTKFRGFTFKEMRREKNNKTEGEEDLPHLL